MARQGRAGWPEGFGTHLRPQCLLHTQYTRGSPSGALGEAQQGAARSSVTSLPFHFQDGTSLFHDLFFSCGFPRAGFVAAAAVFVVVACAEQTVESFFVFQAYRVVQN